MDTLCPESDSGSTPMSISQLSSASGLSKSTIHHYLKLGLLPPPIKARANLYVYTAVHLGWLQHIQHIRGSRNISLTELKEALDKEPLELGGASPAHTDRQEGEVFDLQQTKRLQIIDKSITMFSKFGYEAVKVGDITDALQMGKGTFYLYFKNKRELLLACFDRLYSLLLPLEMWEVVKNEKDIFRKMQYRWIGGNERYSTFSGVLSLIRTSCFWDEDDVKESARKAYDVIIAPIRKDVEEAISSGAIRPVNAELVSFAILGIMEGLSFRLTLDSKYSSADASELVYPFLKSALGAEPERETVEPPAPGSCAKIMDLNGTAIELSELRFGDSPYLAGKLGDAEIRIDPSRIADIAVKCAELKMDVFITAKNGQEMSIGVDKNTPIKGTTPFGELQIPLEKVSRIIFPDK